VKWLSEISSQTPIHPVVTLIEAIGSLIAALASSDNGMALLANKEKTGELKDLCRILAAHGESQSHEIPLSEH
jgi:hypothetical protein